jgi:type VI protein secretion system component Hcp
MEEVTEMTDLIRRARLVPAAAALLAVTGLAIAATLLQPAQAAPVPTAQANCPPPVDPRPVGATTTSYARIDGIQGDATRAAVAGQIVLSSIRTGMMAGGVLCGNAGQVPVFDPIVVEKRVDRASVLLLARASTGTRIPNARLSVWAESGTPRQILTYDLVDVTVVGVRQLQRGDSLTEEVALNFRRITWSFTVTNPDGSAGPTIVACWDIAQRVAC